MRNAQLKFVCQFHHLRVERADTAFTGGYAKHQAIKVCSAHGEGNYIADADYAARAGREKPHRLPLL